jgi:aminoglycoside phosphotransferase (APT) family kinase protein
MTPLSFVSREPIHKGWSSDRKFCVTDANQIRYLLRISDPAQYEEKQMEFQMMERLAGLGVPMCRPIAFGLSEEGVYSVQSWIDGVDLESRIESLSLQKQHCYGLEAGRILKRIHSIPAPEGWEDWEPRFNRKIDRKIRQYSECPIQYEGGEAFLETIRENRHLLKGRPQVYQHGDYHIGNIMLDSAGELQVIDFNRSDFGDPWEEFNRIVWCAQKSPLFASGMVDGYFDGSVPAEFWPLLALYISSNTLASVGWAIPFGQDQVEVMLSQAKDVLGWYDNMKTCLPSWYHASPASL